MALMCHENYSDVPADDNSVGHQEMIAGIAAKLHEWKVEHEAELAAQEPEAV